MAVTEIAVREPTSLVAVHDQCDALEQWAEECESVPELRDAGNKLAAIDEYLSRTSAEGRARVAAAMRRLETRIGQLDEKRKPGPSSCLASNELSKKQRHQFRQMASHPEVVEEVIAESTDGAPASRRKVLDRIRSAKESHPLPDDNKRSRANVEGRERRLKEMAVAGYTTRQIAAELEIEPSTVATIAKRVGVEIHADKVIGKVRLHDSNRILAETVTTLEAVVMALDVVEIERLDPEEVGHWSASLTNSLRSLNRFAKQIKETTTNG